MNYENGQVRGAVPRMPGEYPGNGARPPPVPSGYPAHALPGNSVRYGHRGGGYPQQMGYMGQPPPGQQPRGPYPYPDNTYPGEDNRAYSQPQQQQFYQGPPHPQQQVYYQQPPPQGYQQGYSAPQQYPPTSNPILVHPGSRPPQPPQGFQPQQEQPPNHTGATVDPNSQCNAYGPQQPHPAPHLVPHPAPHPAHPAPHQYIQPYHVQYQPQRFQGPPSHAQQPQPPQYQYQQAATPNQPPMMHSSVNQRPQQHPQFVRGGPPHSVSTGYRNPGVFYARPVRPPVSQPVVYQQQYAPYPPQRPLLHSQQHQQSQGPPQAPESWPQSDQQPQIQMISNAQAEQPHLSVKESQSVTVTSTIVSESVASNETSSVMASTTTQAPSVSSECEVSTATASMASVAEKSSGVSTTPPEDKVQVPWGWKRLSLSDQIIYHSPSGIELKTTEDIKEYLLKEGTCKCGLECPLEVETAFNFDNSKHSVVASIPESPPNPAKYCSHKVAVAGLARILSNPGLGIPFKHLHDPSTGKKGGKKKSSRKKRPYSGILTQQMIEAREAEKRRINEIISQQKKEYEAQMSMSIGGQKNGSLIIKPAPQVIKDTPEVGVPIKYVPEVDASAKDIPEEVPTPPPTLEAEIIAPIDIEAPESGHHSKNIEIRRISATEEGDRVLESAWDSPEKEKDTKTPLQMVQSIVSKLEEAKPQPVKTLSPGPPPPAWTQGSQKPLLHSQKQVANDTPPTTRPLTTVIPPQPQPPQVQIQHKSPTQNLTVMAPAQPQFIPATGQPVMQLVNTINGPMLMQTIAPIAAAPAPQVQVQDKNKAKKGSPTIGAFPTGAPPPNPVPILVSPTATMMPGGQPSPTAQHVLISSHPSPGSGMIQTAPQLVLNQPAMIAPNQVFLSANGTLVAMPTAPAVQNVVYNQLPDGTLVQMQSPMIQAQPQTVLTSNGSFVINNPAQQISPGGGQIQFQAAAPSPNAGTFIMTPAGLVQTVSPHQQQHIQTAAVPSAVASAAASTAVASAAQSQQISGSINAAQQNPPVLEPQEQTPQPGPSSSLFKRKDSTEDTEDDSDDENRSKTTQSSIKFAPTDEDEEVEESSDDEQMLIVQKLQTEAENEGSKSKGGKVKTSSPKISIQSNKVDSSGLQATPPHPNEESESSLNKLSSPEAMGRSYEGLDTSGSTDGSGPSSSTKSPGKRRRKRNADELIRQNLSSSMKSDDSDEDEEITRKSPKFPKQFSIGELVWGPHGSFPSWPGKLIRFERDNSKVLVCWFGNRDTSQVNTHHLKSLSDGLEDHHRERKKLRKGRKMNANLEKAIQEAMMELDRMADD